MRYRLFGLLAACLFAIAGSASAQVQTGEIFGKAADGSGAILPGVSVTVSGPTLLQPRTATTTDSGSYRFPQLPIGTYDVKFELAGFKTIVRQGVRIELGFTAQINAAMEVSAVEETITVTGESPIVDVKETGTGTAFSNEQLQNIPSARDPWVMLERTPGITMDRTNVGGSQSGQQSGYVSRGSSTGNNKWMVDGVDVTDMAATGASPVYFDFDAFDEMQISTGGNDVTQQTGGVGINIVTKSGTDRFKGSARYFVTDDKFEADNLTDEIKQQGAGSGAPIQNIKDIGFEVGGPLWRGRAWFWGGYGKQDIKVGVVNFFKKVSGCPTTAAQAALLDTKTVRNCLSTDLTVLENYNMKASAQAFKGNKVTWHSYYADKSRNARDASDTRPLETTYVQAGPVWTHKFSDQQIFTDRWLGEVQVAHVGGGFELGPQSDDLLDVQPLFDIASGRYERAFTNYSFFDRPAFSVDGTTNYFLPGALGGDHAFKLGFKYRDTPSETNTVYAGGVRAEVRNGVPERATFSRNSSTFYGLVNTSVFAQDTYTRGRSTLLVGFRYDRQDDEAKASEVAANRLLPARLPAIAFSGADAGVVWSDFSPRVGYTFDLGGNGRTVIKVNYARYYGQMGPGTASSPLNPLTAAQITHPWTDTNGDRQVQVGEGNQNTIISFAGNYDPNNPSALSTPNTVDVDLKSDTTDEFIVGLDKQIGRDIAVGGSYIYRKYGRFNWDDRVGLTSANYQPVLYQAPNCPTQATCPTVTYYQPNIPLPAAIVRTNQPGRERKFNGFELTARKRYSNRWMADVSYAFNNAKDYWDEVNGIEDLTNLSNLNGYQYAVEAGGSGIDNVFVNAKWLFKASGMYSFPWDINVAANYNARQGYLFPQAVLSPTRANRVGTVNVLLEPYGESRLDMLQTLDFNASKSFRLFNRVSLKGSVDVFNVGNVNTVLSRRRIQNASNANFVSGITAPRVIRFGIRMSF